MKKRVSNRKKVTKSKSKAWHHKKHLRIHAIFVYTSAIIFLFSIFAAAVHVFIRPIADQQNAFYAPETNILGETKYAEDDEFVKKIQQREESQK